MLGNIFILGDSYSTFEGYIPKGFDAYYTENGPHYLTKSSLLSLTDNDVCDVNHTWWYNLTKENGNLIRNCSWSGTTICNTGYNGSDNSKVSFIARINKLLADGYFDKNKVDTLFLFGGTNDSWSDAPIGEPIESEWTDDDLYKVLPAFSYLIDILVSRLSDTKIYCILNTELKKEITDFYKKICKKNKVDFIELHNIEKVEGHPTINGMLDIKNQILDYVKSR